MKAIHRSLSGSAQRDKKCEPNTTVPFAPCANLLDLRFTDDILICAQPRQERSQLIDSLTIHLEQVGSLLNAEKTVALTNEALTNEAQPPPILATVGGLRLTILQRNVGQKWLGCMLTAAGSQSQHIDPEYHLQQASNFFYENR